MSMTSLQYAIKASKLPFSPSTSDAYKIFQKVPKPIIDAINIADSHEEVVRAYDLVTDWINKELTLLGPASFKQVVNRFLA